MAQQTIDFGSFPNDPGADAIRTAFQKVQQNFTELYTTTTSTGVASVIAGAGITQNRQTGNITLTANIPNITIQTGNSLIVGVGVASGNTATLASYATPFVISLANTITTGNANIGNISVANLLVSGNVRSSLIPNVDVTYNLGSPSRRWKDLYLSGQTIDLGGTLISSSGGVIIVPSLASNSNITASTVTVSTSVVSPTIIIGNTQITSNGTSVVIPALQVAGNIISSNLVVTSSLAAGNVSAAFIQGTLTSSNQPNITSLGILDGLSIIGDLSTGNIVVSGDLAAASMSVSGAFQATTIVGNVIVPAGGTVQAPGSSMQIMFNDQGNAAAVPGLTFDKAVNLLSIAGNVSGGNLVSTGALSISKDATINGNVNAGNLLTGKIQTTGAITAGGSNVSIFPDGNVSAIGNISGGNLTTTGNLSASAVNAGGINASGAAIITGNITGGNLNTTGTANIGSLVITSSASVIGAISAGSLLTSGDITAANIGVGTGSITSGNITVAGLHTTDTLMVSTDANIGNLLTRGNHTVNGNLLSDKLSGNTATIGGGTATLGAKLTVNGIVSLTGNANIGNITAINSVTGNIVTLSGNATGVALVAAGIVRIGGNHTVAGNTQLNQPTSVGVSINVTAASAVSGTITLTYLPQLNAPFFAGQKVLMAGFAPALYNIEYTALTCSNTQVTFAGTTGAFTTLGTINTSGEALTITGLARGTTMVLAGSHTVGGIMDVTGKANLKGGLTALDGTFAGKVDINGNATLYANGDMAAKTFTATLFSGNGSSLSNLSGINIDNSSINASTKLTNLATAVSTLTVAKSVNSDLATTISLGIHSNITGVGTLGNLSILTGGNISGANNVSATKFTGSGAGLTGVTAANVDAANILGQKGMWASTTRPGATRLYRSDDDSNYNVQTTWDGSKWFLQGYSGDVNASSTTTVHAAVRVGYADTAGGVAWSSVSSKPSFATVATSGSYSDLSNKPSIYTPNQSVGTGDNPQFNSIGIGTGASGTAGEIRATNNITAYYSDDKLKTKLGLIENALDKIDTLSGFYYEANETAQSLGYKKKREVGVSAQQVQAIMPEVVVPAPIDDKYLTVHYDRLIPLLIQGIKELRMEIKEIKNKLGDD